MRVSVIAACLSLCLIGFSSADDAHASIRKDTNIPAEGLGPALNALAKDRNFQIVYVTEEIANVRTQGAVGELTTDEALQRLLIGTGLTYRYLDDKTVTIGSATTLHERSGRASKNASYGSSDDTGSNQEGKKSSSGRFRLAQVDQGSNSQSSTIENNSSTSQDTLKKLQLTEIIVTAQKRSEKLMDVPSSIGVMSGTQLESLQSNSLTDFAGYVPGLTVAAGGTPGQNTFVIRGLSTGYTNATTGPLVATYIDDVPVSSSTNAARGALYGFDLMPYDIDRIEVLRGPQGTLYGASAMGGLVKYSLKKPDLTQFDARFGGDVENVNDSGGVNWGGRASVNLPVLEGILGVRVSGFYQHNAGYIDNVGTGTRHANHSNESGGRATVLWKPTDTLSVQATVLAQDIRSADQTAVTLNGTALQPVYGPQAYSTLFPGAYAQQARNYSLSVDWDLPFATLTNSSSWSRLKSVAREDLTAAFGIYVPYPGALADFHLVDKVSKFTEELRLASPQNQRIQWLLGAFYTKEDGGEDNTVPTYTPSYVPLPAADNIYMLSVKKTYKERAAFGNATYQITDRFDVGGGARYAQNTETDCTPVSGGLFGTGPLPCSSRPYVGVATWMADARFHLDRNAMLYLRWATGYRPGGCSNYGCVTNSKLQVPGTFDADKVVNYEAGFKGEFFDHRLQLDLSAFHIDWRDIQATVISPTGFDYAGNGGKASSNGVEATTSYQITASLSLQATLDYTDAHLTQDALGIGGKSGDQLPESPRWSGSLIAEYRQPLGGRRQFVLGGGYRYRDKVLNQFTHNAALGGPFPIGPQNIVDLYTGLTMNRLSGRLYVKNAFNNRSYMGLLYLVDPKMPMFVPVQPRTIGVSLDYQF